ncbi:MAG: TolB family protein [Lewinellaceae bacterium]|nr:TolB family protein [Phaeodactylibacter sp.]MCB9037872.1 TolB family protein [Lewinellaceae bacterium]
MRLLFLLLFFIRLINQLAAQATFPERNLTNHPGNDRYASYSPDGQWIVFESDRNGRWDIFLMDAEGGQLSQLTDLPAGCRRPSWHPNGRKVLFESTRNGATALFEIHTDGSGQKELLRLDTETDAGLFARYAPDGSRIAYALKESETNFNLYLYSIVEDRSTALFTDEYRNVYPQWHPSGKEILFFSRHETNNEDDEIYRMNLKTGKLKRLTNWPQHNFCPAWSADGRRIAYVTSMEGRRPEIYIMKRNGRGRQRITFNEDGDTLPHWHPGGGKLLITGYRGNNFEICEIILSH